MVLSDQQTPVATVYTHMILLDGWIYICVMLSNGRQQQTVLLIHCLSLNTEIFFHSCHIWELGGCTLTSTLELYATNMAYRTVDQMCCFLKTSRFTYTQLPLKKALHPSKETTHHLMNNDSGKFITICNGPQQNNNGIPPIYRWLLSYKDADACCHRKIIMNTSTLSSF